MSPLTLRRNFSWTFIGNAVYSACQWGMLVVLAKLGSPEMVGQFTLGLAITAPVFMLTNLQLRSLQATDAKHEYRFGDYLSLRLIGTLLALIVIVGVSLKAGYSWELFLVVMAIALAKAFEAISDVFYGLVQNYERMDRIALSLIIKGPLSLILMGIGVYLTHNVLGGVLGLAISWGAMLLIFDIRSGAMLIESSPLAREDLAARNLLLPLWNLKTLVNLLWLSLPLGVVMMLISLNTNIPRYFIEQYLGARELGIFGAISYLMVAGNMVIGALAQSATPRLAKYYAANNSRAFRNLLLKLVAIGILVGGAAVLAAVVAGREILTILYRPEYAEQTDVFVLLMVAAGVSYVASFLGYGMTAARYFRIQMPLFMVVTGISALACFWLIPSKGLQGAAIALIIGAIIQAVFSLGVISHALYKLDRYRDSETANSII